MPRPERTGERKRRKKERRERERERERGPLMEKNPISSSWQSRPKEEEEEEDICRR